MSQKVMADYYRDNRSYSADRSSSGRRYADSRDRRSNDDDRRYRAQRETDRRRNALLREKKQVRHQVRFTGIVAAVLFGALIVYLLVYSNVEARTLYENDYNKRQAEQLAKNIRGKIYSADGQVLAETTTDADGNDVRSYPQGSLFSHIIGYTYKGGSGVEQLEDYDLTHSDISLSEKASYDESGTKYPANDVYTTLRTDLQQSASDALGDNRGAVIVTEVGTGKILAMVSKPDFDPNNIEAEWEALGADPDSGTLVNRATQGIYAPGSTFKIFDVIELLQEDMNNANSFSYDCTGYTTIEDNVINCYHWTAHGEEDLETAFAKSCNCAFVTIGNSLDRTTWAQTLNNCMFGETLPYDLPTGTSSYSLDDTTSTDDVLQLAIGQGATQITPMHLNMITDAIANGGMVYKDQIIDSVKTGTGTATLSETKPEQYRQICSADIAAKLREYMRAVVEEGTASKLSNRPYNAAGKTGSAEIVTGESTSHAWFTGFAPYENPEIAITVIVEGAGSGGMSAVPVARDVLDTYFGYTPSEGEDTDFSYVQSSGTTGNGTTDYTGTAGGTSVDPATGGGTTVTLNMDTNGDGVMDAIDTNGDGQADAWDLDGDGVPESYSPTPSGTTTGATGTGADSGTLTDSGTGTGTDNTVTGTDQTGADGTAGTANDGTAGTYTGTDSFNGNGTGYGDGTGTGTGDLNGTGAGNDNGTGTGDAGTGIQTYGGDSGAGTQGNSTVPEGNGTVTDQSELDQILQDAQNGGQ